MRPQGRTHADCAHEDDRERDQHRDRGDDYQGEHHLDPYSRPRQEDDMKRQVMRGLDRTTLSAIALTLLVAAVSSRLLAQTSNKEAPAVVGHFHLNVTSIDAHKKFWADTLGGKAEKLGSTTSTSSGSPIR